jgi:5-methylcytosine-specific restriction endonuclease McrA
LESSKEYYANNKDAIRLKAKEYYEANKGRFNAWSKKYKLRKIQRTPKWLTNEDYLKIESLYELSQRLSMDTGILHHVDHIIPLKGGLVSGLHTPDNLQVIPWMCNLQKSNKFKI